MGRVPFVLLVALCGCTQDFDKFLGDSGGATDGGDGGAGDAAADGPSCNVSQTCLAAASTCGQSCVSGYNTCLGNCNTQPCKGQCKNQETTCRTVCTSSCEECADAGTCADSICQGVLP